MTTIIQCPNCAARYRVMITIARGQLVRCPRCQFVWRFGEESSAQFGLGAAAADARAGAGAGSDEMHGGRSHAQVETAGSGRFSRLGGYDTPDAEVARTSLNDDSEEQDPAGEDGRYEAGSEAQDERTSYDETAQAYRETAEAGDDNKDEGAGNGYSRRGIEREPAFGDGFYSAFDEARRSSTEMDEEDLALKEQAFRASGGYKRARAQRHDFAREMADVLDRSPYQGEVGESDDEGLENQTSEYEENSAGYRSGEDGATSDPDNDYAAADSTLPGTEQQAGPYSGPLWPDGDANDRQERETLSAFAPRRPLETAADVAGPARDARNGYGGLAVAAAWATYLIVVGGLAAGALFFKDNIVKAMPGAARYYAMLGIEKPVKVLTFESVSYEISTRDDRTVLEVRGLVVNTTDRSVDVPTLYITVRDDSNAVIANTAAVVVKNPLPAQAKAPFTLEFLSPPSNLSAIELRFAGSI